MGIGLFCVYFDVNSFVTGGQLKVQLKTVLKLDKIGFSLSILMVCYLAGFHLLIPHEGALREQNPGLSHMLPLIYAMIMSLLCGLNVLKIRKIRKKFIKPHHRQNYSELPDQT